jgi:hypothetical protein
VIDDQGAIVPTTQDDPGAGDTRATLKARAAEDPEKFITEAADHISRIAKLLPIDPAADARLEAWLRAREEGGKEKTRLKAQAARLGLVVVEREKLRKVLEIEGGEEYYSIEDCCAWEGCDFGYFVYHDGSHSGDCPLAEDGE